MILPKFDYHSPRTLQEAFEIISNETNFKILGGGTDLLVDIRSKAIPDELRIKFQTPNANQSASKKNLPETLIALSRIPTLKGIYPKGESIRIGAMTPIRELIRSKIIQKYLRGIIDGAEQLGSPLVRNRGTYGGNICNARPAADTSIPTLALSGELVLVSKSGERIIKHNVFVTGPGKTIIRNDEILKEILIPLPQSDRFGSSYIKLANRKALEISVVGAATAIGFAKSKKVESVHIALGAVAPTPLLVEGVEAILVGKVFTERLAEKAAGYAADYSHPITDHRGSKEYRKLMVKVLVRRALILSFERAFEDGRGKS
ncbi:FAD binding domain-containing protein [bacterium]|nr:FAD binding domain-containing protein [bacterium]